MSNNKVDDQTFLREILTERGYYKKWHAQVMADILLPYVQENVRPENNGILAEFKSNCNNMLALYLVKEFLRNMGLPSTERMFEVEVGIEGQEHDYQEQIASSFSLLRLSNCQELQPPLLSQILHVWKMEFEECRKREVAKASENSSIVVRGGLAQNLRPSMANVPGLAREYSQEYSQDSYDQTDPIWGT